LEDLDSKPRLKRSQSWSGFIPYRCTALYEQKEELPVAAHYSPQEKYYPFVKGSKGPGSCAATSVGGEGASAVDSPDSPRVSWQTTFSTMTSSSVGSEGGLKEVRLSWSSLSLLAENEGSATSSPTEDELPEDEDCSCLFSETIGYVNSGYKEKTTAANKPLMRQFLEWDGDEDDDGKANSEEEAPSELLLAATCEEFYQANITTLMLRNVPVARTKQNLIDELDNCGFRNRYDFCYLPRSFKTGKNRGFAFINFVNTDEAAKLKVMWNKSRRFVAHARDKLLDVGIAEVQGRDAYMEKAYSAKMGRIKNADFRPFVMELACPTKS
jgi:hypothetical protein